MATGVQNSTYSTLTTDIPMQTTNGTIMSSSTISTNVSTGNLSCSNGTYFVHCGNSTDDDRFNSDILWKVNVIYYIIVVPLAVIGNSLSVACAATIVRHRKSIPDLLIGTLATSDLLMTITVHSFSIVSLAAGRWVGAETTCDAQYSLSWMFWKFAFFNIQTQTIDRYLAINKPLYYRSNVTIRKILYCLFVFTTFSLLTSTFTAIYNSDQLGLKHGWFICLDYHANKEDLYFILVFALNSGIFALGVGVFIFCNVAVSLTLCRFRRNTTAVDSGSEARARSERRFAVLIMAISIVYACFWLPYINFIVLDFLKISFSVYAENVAFMLLYTNAVINPLLCILFKRPYRRGALYFIRLVFYYVSGCAIKPLKDDDIFYERRSTRRKRVATERYPEGNQRPDEYQSQIIPPDIHEKILSNVNPTFDMDEKQPQALHKPAEQRPNVTQQTPGKSEESISDCTLSEYHIGSKLTCVNGNCIKRCSGTVPSNIDISLIGASSNHTETKERDEIAFQSNRLTTNSNHVDTTSRRNSIKLPVTENGTRCTSDGLQDDDTRTVNECDQFSNKALNSNTLFHETTRL